ncbi:glycine receptor subunit alpha-2 isoform X2 [Anoplophora glabripennis]|uniref:glycine receptor subunit alpha-2 isoform X2 n=1 Tax=Anoplophora glabripennis TaxID=217634 RepID=UPI0008758458|nr:glycine receptor subunit alpha-2 isoform X2 [Anoplophora glabripennis]
MLIMWTHMLRDNKSVLLVLCWFALIFAVNAGRISSRQENVMSIAAKNVSAVSDPPISTDLPPTDQNLTSNATDQQTQAVSDVTTTPSTVPTTTIPKPTMSIEAARDELQIDPCPALSALPIIDNLTQDEFISKLTDGCRYDRLIKPPTDGPLNVLIQIDMKHIESADHLFKSHILVHLYYRDSRLNYSKISPERGEILGEESLRNKIWVPHIIISNERDSALMGLDGKDVIVQIKPSGEVKYSYRMTTTFYCWMNLQKFPFDCQICSIQWVSWAYNLTSLELNWVNLQPYHVASNLHLTEFILEDMWSKKNVVPTSYSLGGISENSSAVEFTFRLRREVGYYIMDYFLPSMLLVGISWVTFWLQADAAAPRITLGTATMLAFVTLNGGLSKNLPKVSYIKASEIWFLGCATFIFLSIAEFAFVNVIWRRKKKVELKKQNSKHILKGAITPSLARKQLRKVESVNSLYKTRSCSSLDGENAKKNLQANYLTVHSFPTNLSVPIITTQSQDDLISSEESVTTIPIPDNASRPPTPPAWTTMTPQEVANWIDKKSRVVFPCAFLIFNIFYWSFVYAL